MTRFLLLTVALGAALLAGAEAQDTGGVAAPPGRKGTVLKSKAPVAKEILRVRFPRPRAFTLSNGLRVYVLEDHRLPTFQCSLMMKAGTLFDPKPGTAGLTAAMLTEGTRSHTAQELARETETLGASLDASAQSELAVLSVSGLSEYQDRLIALMAETLLTPTFPQDRLLRVKYQTTAALLQQRAGAGFLASEMAAKVFYGSTPYARVSPTAEEIAALTREDLAAFHARFYRPDGAVLGVAGDVKARAVVEKLEQALEGWKAAGQEPDLPKADFAPKEKTRIFLINRPGSVQTALRFGNLAIRRTDPDYIPLVIANRILGGAGSARLFQNLREEKGYTYGAYSALSTPRWPGTWTAAADVRTPVTEPSVREFFAEFKRLQEEPVSQEELDRAKRGIVGSFARTLESPQGILNRTLELVLNGLPLDYWDTYPEKIQAVSPEDVRRVARKYLGEGRIQLIAVGEREKIEPGLKQYGPVEVYDAGGKPVAP
jgi:predicted Zn-dependent peptidase